MRIFRKWWLVRELRNESRRHGLEKLSLEGIFLNWKHSISRADLVKQVVRKSVERFSWILRWRKKENEVKSKKRGQEYNSIFDEYLREGLIYQEPTGTLMEQGVVLNPEGRPFIRTTDLGDKFVSTFWWKILFDNSVSKALMIAVITGLTGIFLKNQFEDITQVPPAAPTINVTSPEVRPAINIYPVINLKQDSQSVPSAR